MFTLEHVEDALNKHVARHGLAVCTVCRGWQNVVYSMLKGCIERNQTNPDNTDIIKTLDRYAEYCSKFEVQDS